MTAMDMIQSVYSRGHGTTTASATRVSADTVICDACGCRLTTRDRAGAAGPWFHFAGLDGHDARGCTIACADAPHTLG